MQDATRHPAFCFAAHLFDELARGGVRDVIVSPGSRSAPLAAAAWRAPGLRCWSQIDERSGAFFALGLARASRQPVAIVCTSGTAAANYHPAVIEAHHARVPLLVLTADRPPELRDWGAGQTIDQVGLYGGAVRWFAEAPVPEPTGLDLPRIGRALAARALASAVGRPAGPVHLNLPFREPLTPPREEAEQGGTARCAGAPGTVRVHVPAPALDTSRVDRLRRRFADDERGVVICGPLDADPGTAVAIARLADALGWPLLADPLSQLRRGPQARVGTLVAGYDLFLRDRETAGLLAPRTVLRFGDTPTSKPLRLWLEAHRPDTTVLVDPDGVWHDPSHLTTEALQVEPRAFAEALRDGLPSEAPDTGWRRAFAAAERCTQQAVAREIAAAPALLEARAAREIATALPEGALLYVSSSMPVRDVDAFVPPCASPLRILSNRGANGIDGVVSSALGAAASGEGRVVLLTGDLAFLHDAGGLLGAARNGVDATIVVVDNGGGGIFSFLPIAEHGREVGFEPHFRTPHGLDLCQVARAYGASALRVSSWEHLHTAWKEALDAPGVNVLVVPVDRDANVAQHRQIQRAVCDALGAVTWPL